VHNDDMTGRGHRIFASAEAAINKSLTLLAREDAHFHNRLLATGLGRTGSTQSVLAMAFRPAGRSDWNALAKLELRNDENPNRPGFAALNGTDRRIIAAIEPVWTPRAGSELSLRYAVRKSEIDMSGMGDGAIAGISHFAGARVQHDVLSRVDLRATTRFIQENGSGLTRWDLAPAVGVKLIQGLDLETGYRFGTLRDADFAQDGGRGFYATLGMSITEKTGRSIADFWRTRLGGGR
jgi:hypothetical protein